MHRGQTAVALYFVISSFVLFAVISSNVTLAQTHPAEVPRVIRYSGTLKNADGSPRVGTVGVTFSIYAGQSGAAPLYQEIQNVAADETGHYTVLIGAARSEGLSDQLFVANDARWLAIRVENEAEQPRVLLAAVPYALKAADAETLAGKPLSAFVLSTAGNHDRTGDATETSPSEIRTPAGTLHPNAIADSTGAAHQLAKWSDATTLTGSTVAEFGGNLGIGTSTPQSALHI
jgi:hypothetical protein